MYFSKEENTGVIMLSNGNNPYCMPEIAGSLFDYASEYTDIIEEKNIAEKQETHLSNYPNPFNPTTTIDFDLDQEAEVTLSIYNVKGQLVAKLLNEESRKSGSHCVIWNGQNNTGLSVASGVYYCKLETDDSTEIKRMLLLK